MPNAPRQFKPPWARSSSKTAKAETRKTSTARGYDGRWNRCSAWRRGLQKLRRSAATHLCRERGIEAASMLLGHLSDVGLAKRNYVDATQGYALPPLPPALPLKPKPVALLGGPRNDA